VDSTYEPPYNPDLVLKAGEWSISECVEHVINMLEQNVSALHFESEHFVMQAELHSTI